MSAKFYIFYIFFLLLLSLNAVASEKVEISDKNKTLIKQELENLHEIESKFAINSWEGIKALKTLTQFYFDLDDPTCIEYAKRWYCATENVIKKLGNSKVGLLKDNKYLLARPKQIEYYAYCKFQDKDNALIAGAQLFDLLEEMSRNKEPINAELLAISFAACEYGDVSGVHRGIALIKQFLRSNQFTSSKEKAELENDLPILEANVENIAKRDSFRGKNAVEIMKHTLRMNAGHFAQYENEQVYEQEKERSNSQKTETKNIILREARMVKLLDDSNAKGEGSGLNPVSVDAVLAAGSKERLEFNTVFNRYIEQEELAKARELLEEIWSIIQICPKGSSKINLEIVYAELSLYYYTMIRDFQTFQKHALMLEQLLSTNRSAYNSFNYFDIIHELDYNYAIFAARSGNTKLFDERVDKMQKDISRNVDFASWDISKRLSIWCNFGDMYLESGDPHTALKYYRSVEAEAMKIANEVTDKKYDLAFINATTLTDFVQSWQLALETYTRIILGILRSAQKAHEWDIAHNAESDFFKFYNNLQLPIEAQGMSLQFDRITIFNKLQKGEDKHSNSHFDFFAWMSGALWRVKNAADQGGLA